MNFQKEIKEAKERIIQGIEEVQKLDEELKELDQAPPRKTAVERGFEYLRRKKEEDGRGAPKKKEEDKRQIRVVFRVNEEEAAFLDSLRLEGESRQKAVRRILMALRTQNAD